MNGTAWLVMAVVSTVALVGGLVLGWKLRRTYRNDLNAQVDALLKTRRKLLNEREQLRQDLAGLPGMRRLRDLDSMGFPLTSPKREPALYAEHEV